MGGRLSVEQSQRWSTEFAPLNGLRGDRGRSLTPGGTQGTTNLIRRAGTPTERWRLAGLPRALGSPWSDVGLWPQALGQQRRSAKRVRAGIGQLSERSACPVAAGQLPGVLGLPRFVGVDPDVGLLVRRARTERRAVQRDVVTAQQRQRRGEVVGLDQDVARLG